MRSVDAPPPSPHSVAHYKGKCSSSSTLSLGNTSHHAAGLITATPTREVATFPSFLCVKVLVVILKAFRGEKVAEPSSNCEVCTHPPAVKQDPRRRHEMNSEKKYNCHKKKEIRIAKSIAFPKIDGFSHHTFPQ